MVLINSGFPHAKDLLRKLSVIWVRAFIMSASPVQCRKILNNIGSTERLTTALPQAPINDLSVAPICLGSAMIYRDIISSDNCRLSLPVALLKLYNFDVQ
jgi:hypothetical protein